jgi:tRNA (guanine-N7-)-methyltransferase
MGEVEKRQALRPAFSIPFDAMAECEQNPDAVETARIMPESWLDSLPVESISDPRKPLEVDIGCGKGRFLLARAAAHPDVHFLGIERLLRRIRKVDRKVLRRGLDNIRLLRVEASYAVQYLIPDRAVDVYYVWFPDPWPKKRHVGNRLFDREFLDALARTLKTGGLLHVATDHMPYFEQIESLLRKDNRFEAVEPFVPSAEERTDYELLFLGSKPIGRCSVRRNGHAHPAAMGESG